jgi:hypothetical protein
MSLPNLFKVSKVEEKALPNLFKTSKVEEKFLPNLFKTSKVEEKVEKKALPKLAKAKVKKAEFFMLFDVNQFGNSIDTARELDSAFHGIFSSKDSALSYFANFMVEATDENLTEEFFDENDNLLEDVEDKLEKYGWKIISSELSE